MADKYTKTKLNKMTLSEKAKLVKGILGDVDTQAAKTAVNSLPKALYPETATEGADAVRKRKLEVAAQTAEPSAVTSIKSITSKPRTVINNLSIKDRMAAKNFDQAGATAALENVGIDPTIAASSANRTQQYLASAMKVLDEYEKQRPASYQEATASGAYTQEELNELAQHSKENILAREAWDQENRSSGDGAYDTWDNVLNGMSGVSDDYLKYIRDTVIPQNISAIEQNNAAVDERIANATTSDLYADEIAGERNRLMTETVVDIYRGKGTTAANAEALRSVFGDNMTDAEVEAMVSEIKADPEAFLEQHLVDTEQYYDQYKKDDRTSAYEQLGEDINTELANREAYNAAMDEFAVPEDYDQNNTAALADDGKYTGDISHIYMYFNYPGYKEKFDNSWYQQYFMRLGTSFTDPIDYDWKYMSSEEKAEFKYAFEQSEETAERFLASLRSTGVLDRRKAEAQVYGYTNDAENYPVLSKTVTFGTTLANAAVAPVQLVAEATGLETDPNSGLYDLNRFNTTVRGTVNQMANEVTPVLGFVDNVVTSVVDNLIAIGVSKGAVSAAGVTGEAANKLVTGLTQSIMSSNASSSTLYESLQNGEDQTTAVMKALASGGIEALTEKYSIETLLGDPTGAWKHLAKNFLAESSEEVASDLLNPIADAFISGITGSRTDIEREYNNYLLQGYSEKEASDMVMNGFVKDLVYDFFAGGFAGAFGASAFIANNAYQGSQIKKSGSTSKLVEIAEKMPEGSQSRKYADAVKRTGSNYATAQLYSTLMQDLDSASQETVTSIAAGELASKLREGGETGDSETVARNILKVYHGETLTEAERNTILNSKRGAELMDQASLVSSRDSTEMKAYKEAYSAGFYGRESTQNMNQTYYQAGVKAAQVAEQKRLAAVGTGKAGTGSVSYIGTVLSDADISKKNAMKIGANTFTHLEEQQQIAAAAIQDIAKATSLNFVLYEGQADDSGAITIENGKYEGMTNTLYIDLNSGKNRSGQGVIDYTIMQTVAHETTHFIARNSKSGYATLQNLVRKTLEERGQDFDELVRQKIRIAERNGNELTREGAVEEVVANASEMMLKDTKVFQQLAKQNKSLVEKVKTFVSDLLSKIRKALGKVGAQHPEAKALMEAEQYVAGLQEAWDAALVEAVETVKGSETGETWNGIPVVDKFELRNPVEKKGNLVATHAVSDQNLMRMLDEGTMVGLSVAVSKIGKSSNTMFGDNTLVFYASAIDPEANPDNHIFGFDAWTPRRTAKEVYVRNESIIQQARETYVKTLQDSGIDAGIVESLESFFDNHVEAKSKDWIDTKNGMRNVFFDSPPSIGVYNPGIAALYALNVGLTAEDINEAYHQNARGLVEAIRSNSEAQKGLKQLASKITSGFYENRLFEPGITDANERADSTLSDITVANTPDNALAIMKQKPLTDQGDSTGANGIRRKIPLVYNNLNEVRNDQARLTDDVNAIAESVIDTETALEKFKEEISFGRQSTGKIEGILQNAAANNQSISNTVRALWKAGYIKANKKNVGEVMDAIQSFRNSPTDYFEAKLMRKSSFSEVAAAVVRESSTDLISRLKENGFRVLTYDGTLNDRIAKVNSVNEAKFSLRESEYASAVESGDMDTAQRMVDEVAQDAGYTIRAYHGTGRADRVGTVFRADRATSGPMAFFTSDPQIAANYARDKADTSLAYDEEYSDYYTQFRVTRNGKSVAVKDLWRSLPFSEKQKIKEAGKHITWDDDMENIIWDDDADRGLGNWDNYTLREHNGNALEALVDSWLESGELYGNEGEFLKVLELAGIKDAEYRDPDARHEKVYDTYLKIQNPFNTATVDEAFIEGYEAWYQQQPEGKYDRQSADADMWDKNSMTAERFVERVHDDLANGTTNAWTSIPDSVTDYLKALGHDGIQDVGGKQGGDSHTVWIPFTSEQIKDASPVTYDDAGNVIPLSKRFDTTQQDIRYSVRETDQLDEDKYFSRIVDKWDGTSSGGRMKVGQIKTGSIYTAVGLPAGELFFDYSKAAKALGKHGDHLTKDSIKQIPKMLSNPIVITEPINEHVKNTINVFGEMIGDNGKPIMVSIMMRPDVSGTYLLNIVRTFEMRSDVNRLITPDTLLYITENKKRAQDWFLRLGNKNVPFAVNQYGLIRSIAYTNENSNPSSEKFSLRAKETEEKEQAARRVYGTVNGQNYVAVRGDSVPLEKSGYRKVGNDYEIFYTEDGSYEVPANSDPDTLVITKLPRSHKDTRNAILTDGRIALNYYSSTENTRYKVQAMVENEIYLLSGVREDGVFYRVTGNDADAGYLRDGNIRKSVNHATGQEEDGVSVWEYPKYADKHTHKVSGEVVGIGADGEPLLDPSTVRLVSDDVQNLFEKRKEGRELFKKRYNWTDAQIDQALNGGYKYSQARYSLRDQTDTPEFQRWFKDSEVVDDEGNPLVVYHTTDSDFTTFDSSFLGSITDSNASDGYLAATAHVGFWFNTQDLTSRIGGKAMPVYLSSQRMYEVGTLDALTNEIWDAYTDDYDTEDPSIESAADAGESYRRYLESRGYDGIMVTDTEFGGTSYVVFEPEQIKSATDNVGTFDPSNPDIRYSPRTETEAELTDAYLANMSEADVDTDSERVFLKQYQTLRAKYIEARSAYDKAVRSMNERVEKGELTGDELIRQQNRVEILKKRMTSSQNKFEILRENTEAKTLTDKVSKFVRKNIKDKSNADINKLIDETEAEIKRLAELTDAPAEKLAAERKRLQKLQSKPTQQAMEERSILETSQRAAAMERRISKKVSKLNNMLLHETDYKNVPEELKGFVANVVKTFGTDFSGMAFSPEKAASIVAMYDHLQTNDSSFAKTMFNDDISDMFHELIDHAKLYQQLKNGTLTDENGKPLGRKALAEIRYEIADDVNTMVNYVDTMVKRSTETRVNGRKAYFESLANETISEMLERPDRLEYQNKLGDTLSWMERAIVTGNMTPVYFFDQLGNKVLKNMFKDFMTGANQWAFISKSAQEYIQNVRKQYKYSSWVDGEALEMTTQQGQKIKLTKEQALWMYATWKREHSNPIAATKHLEKGGFVYEGRSGVAAKKTLLGTKAAERTTGTLINDADMQTINGYLTEQEKGYADTLVKYLSTEMGALGNEISMELYGIRKYKEGYYFPYAVVRDQKFQKSASGGGAVSDDNRIKHASFTHALSTGASKALVLGNFSDVVVNHIGQMAMYYGMTLPIENMNRVLNYQYKTGNGNDTTVRSLIRQKYGSNTLVYMERFLRDANGGVRADRSAFENFVGKFKKAAVVGSLSVSLQQTSAMLRAGAMMNYKYLLQQPLYYKKEYNQLMEHSGVAIIKQMGRFDTNVGQSYNEWMQESAETELNLWGKIRNKAEAVTFGLPNTMDEMAWGMLWKAVKSEQADLHPNMDKTSNEFLDMCGERFNDIAYHTQVFDSTLTRSQLMRSTNPIDQMATTFRAEPTLTLNVLYDAFFNKNIPKGERAKRRVSALSAVMLSSIAAAFGSAMISAWGDDDDDRTAAEKIVRTTNENFWSNLLPWYNIPYISDIVSLLEGYDVERADMSLFQDVVNGFNKVQQWRKGNTTWYRALEEFGGSLANFLGVPAKNIMRDLRRIYNMAHTRWEKPTQTGMEAALMPDAAIPGWEYDTSTTAYYDRLVSAYVKGDTVKAKDIETYIQTVGGKDAEQIRDGVKAAVGDRFEAGSMTETDGINLLYKLYGKEKNYDKDSLYFYFDKLKDKMSGKLQKGDTYSKMTDFYTAVETGKGLTSEITMLKKHGSTNKSLASAITNHFSDTYISLYKTNKTEASRLQSRLLTAYEALGYKREDKIKDIQQWVENDKKKNKTTK